jgi:Putative beta-barrel porin 2
MTTNEIGCLPRRAKNACLEFLGPAATAALLSVLGIGTASAAFDYHDTLERVVDPTGIPDLSNGNLWDLFVADQESYDNNLYRLPANVADLAALGIAVPTGSRQDHINTSSVGLDGSWSLGRQIFVVDLRADENRYAQSTNLDYVSTADKVIWDWQILSTLSGQVGADYTRTLAGFVNSFVYTKNVVDTAQYFAGGRWTVGPHWTVFGGVVDSDTKLSAAASRINDNNNESGAVGAELATNAVNTIGAEYRFTKVTYASAATSGSDYNEDRARAYIKYVFSDKTEIDASAGYLWRNYPSENRAVGDFAGNVWRISAQWQVTDKTQLIAQGWRELQAYITQDTNYYVSNGVSIAPTWNPTESINLTLTASTEKQDYIGDATTETGLTDVASVPGSGARHDRLNTAQAAIAYTPNYPLWRDLTLNVSARHEQRSSNDYRFTYNDTIVYVGLTFKYSR